MTNDNAFCIMIAIIFLGFAGCQAMQYVTQSQVEIAKIQAQYPQPIQK